MLLAGDELAVEVAGLIERLLFSVKLGVGVFRGDFSGELSFDGDESTLECFGDFVALFLLEPVLSFILGLSICLATTSLLYY